MKLRRKPIIARCRRNVKILLALFLAVFLALFLAVFLAFFSRGFSRGFSHGFLALFLAVFSRFSRGFSRGRVKTLSHPSRRGLTERVRLPKGAIFILSGGLENGGDSVQRQNRMKFFLFYCNRACGVV